MQTSAHPDAGAVFAPVTPAVAKLLHSLQRELLRAPDAPAPIPPGAVVLPAPGTSAGLDGIRLRPDGLGAEVRRGDVEYTWLTQRAQPDWAHRYGPLCYAPGRYTVHEVRRDARGRTWHCTWAADLADDGFGNLVEVAE